MLRRLSLILVLAIAAPALAQSSREELSTQLRQKERLRDDLTAEARATALEVGQLRARLIQVATAQSAADGRVSVDRSRFEALNAQEQALAGRMSANRTQLSHLLGALQLYSRNPPPALLVSPGSARDAVNAAILMRAIAPDLERRAQALRLEAEAFQRLRRQTALAHETLFTSESAAAEGRTELERLIAAKSELEARLLADAGRAEQDARALQAKITSLGGLVRGLRGPDISPPQTALGPLRRPVEGEIVTGFGGRTQSGGRSDGLTWKAGPGAPVLSPGAGTVEYAGPVKGWSQVVVINLGGGWRVVLAGLERTATAQGRSVAAGEPIGLMAKTAGGAQLYMELRKDGQVTDPARRLDAR